MKGTPFISFQSEGGLVAARSGYNWTTSDDEEEERRRRERKQHKGGEPRSVLDSPPTSTSTSTSTTLSSSFGGGSDSAGGVAALSDKWRPTITSSGGGGGGDGGDSRKEAEWASELQPIPAGDPKRGGGLDEWEAVLSETAAVTAAEGGSPGHEQTFLRWIMGDIDDEASGQPMAPPPVEFEPFGSLIDPAGFGPLENPSASAPLLFQETLDEKPPHHLFINNHQLHPCFFQPPPHDLVVAPPNPKRHQPFHTPAKPKDEAAAVFVAQQQQQQQAVVDQLLRAAELVEAGDPFSAREILARLNHQLPPSPLGLKPLLRSAFLFRDALLALLLPPANATTITNPWDVVLKLSSYKALADVSPLLHFASLTCTQALLDELGAFHRIHIVDFDIGVGGQWSSFMQELAHRRPHSPPLLKITAFVSPQSLHLLELHLTRDNLSHFAASLNIPFQFDFFTVDSFNPAELLLAVPRDGLAVAVNLPVGSHYPQPFPTLLRLVKQLNPNIVVSTDQGCDRSDLPFSHHFLHSFQACVVLLDSIDAAGASAQVAHEIERLLLHPRAEAAVVGRHRTAGQKMPPWRALFASMGFAPHQFSNFAEAQAECLLKRVQVRGFHVEKRQASLFLYWQRRELGCVSAWKC